MGNVWRSARLTLETIKWEHSIFALPFALTGAVLAAGGWPRPAVLGWIVLCMVSARSACVMAFNRLVDARLDAANPRDEDACAASGEVERGICGGIRGGVGGGVCAGRGDVEPADAGGRQGRRWWFCWRTAL